MCAFWKVTSTNTYKSLVFGTRTQNTQKDRTASRMFDATRQTHVANLTCWLHICRTHRCNITNTHQNETTKHTWSRKHCKCTYPMQQTYWTTHRNVKLVMSDTLDTRRNMKITMWNTGTRHSITIPKSNMWNAHVAKLHFRDPICEQRVADLHVWDPTRESKDVVKWHVQHASTAS